MPLTYSLDDLYRAAKDELGFPMKKIVFIRLLNRLLLDLNITKPAERISNIYFVKEFRKYPWPTDGREPIGFRDTARVFNDRPFKRLSPAIVTQRSFGEMYAVMGNAGVTYLEVLHQRGISSYVLMTGCESLTADGVWTAGSGVSNIALNTATKHKGNSSVGFSISGATAEISFIKTDPIDASAFTEHQGHGAFLWLPTAPTQITVKWGSSASNYYQQTITTQANGEAFDSADKNEIRTDRHDATETGSVDDENIKYFSYTYTFASSITDTDFLIDDPAIFKPEILKFDYYSSYVAENSSGVLIPKITVSASSTDVPLIFDDYIPTILNGLGWLFFRKKKLELSKEYKEDYISIEAPSGALVGGKRFLERKYPNRAQNIKRGILLAPLYG